MTEKMPRHRIRAHYEQLSEFERGCITGLKEAARLPDIPLIEGYQDNPRDPTGACQEGPDNRSKFGKKYRRRTSGCFITLYHVVWQLASRLEVGQHITEPVTL
ncbi:hypothetical protein TNCV_4143991 [Trichonephila clavipes]|nr:hypothetical protein TNCV_4143991 [Trichonephila clavipes]